jgi:hypothetical protein
MRRNPPAVVQGVGLAQGVTGYGRISRLAICVVCANCSMAGTKAGSSALFGSMSQQTQYQEHR